MRSHPTTMRTIMSRCRHLASHLMPRSLVGHLFQVFIYCTWSLHILTFAQHSKPITPRIETPSNGPTSQQQSIEDQELMEDANVKAEQGLMEKEMEKEHHAQLAT
ncbi:hypothetical protein J6590_094644 [Homalodisca vitripennis]|nr:hypothetical protein J6590_094644 [Homalodisca vitripennis]